ADADAAGGPAIVDGFVDAVGYLEQALGDARMPGVLHCRCGWAAHAAAAHNVAIRDASGDYYSPLGHRWVFGSGYDQVLGNTLVATTAKLVGFRNPVETRQTDPSDAMTGVFQVIAERSLVVFYEAVVGACTIVEPGGSL
ncbi:MAG TPA: hypothetical protein VMU34_05165, partial [Mycobacterium sp.]|nr:hypothetical protein [Mycobacterium sp.]